MDCEQLVRLIKEWGLQVKQETMAIARMKLFVDQHVKKCPVCARDLIMPDELEKIYEYLVPGSARNLVPASPESAEGENPDGEDAEAAEGDVDEDFADEVGDEEPDEAAGDDDDDV